MNTQAIEKRPLGALGRIGMVAGLHAGALYLIAASLGVVPSLVEKEPPVITLTPQAVAPPEPATPPPRPQSYRPQVYVPTPVAPPQQVDIENGIIAERNDDPPMIPDVLPPSHTPQIVGVRQDSRYPLTQPTYPISDIRNGREGTVELEVYVLPTGRIGDVRVVKSTGSATMDQSAVDEAKRKWRLMPATRDGEPYAQWHRLKVTFNLQNR